MLVFGTVYGFVFPNRDRSCAGTGDTARILGMVDADQSRADGEHRI